MKKFRITLVDYDLDIIHLGCATLVPITEKEKFPMVFDSEKRRLGRLENCWPMFYHNRFGGIEYTIPKNIPEEILDTIKQIVVKPGLIDELLNYTVIWDCPSLTRPEIDGLKYCGIPDKHISYFEIALGDDESFDMNKLFLPAICEGAPHFSSHSRFIIYDGVWYNCLSNRGDRSLC